MATVLALVNRIGAELALVELTSLVGNGEDTARRLLELAQQAGQEVAFGPVRAGATPRWERLTLEATITTSDGDLDYALEADFHHAVDHTLWDRTNYWQMRGSLTPATWQHYKSGLIATGVLEPEFRFKVVSGAKQLVLLNDPDGVRTLVYEYVSSHWCESSGGTGQASIAADTDVLRIDEALFLDSLRWRALRRFGEAYADERDDFEDKMAERFAEDVPRGALNMGAGHPRRPEALLQDFDVVES